MSKFEYVTNVDVKLDGKTIGTIREQADGGWQYFPKGAKTGGQVYRTQIGCRLSLETE